jgi:hypothetical protein
MKYHGKIPGPLHKISQPMDQIDRSHGYLTNLHLPLVVDEDVRRSQRVVF